MSANLSKFELIGIGDTDLDLESNGDFVKFCGISSFLTGSVGKSNGLLGIKSPLGNPGTLEKWGGRPAAARLDKLDVNEDKLVGRPPAKLDARLEGIPGDNPDIIPGDIPGLDEGGRGNLGIGGPPGIPGPPVRGGTPPANI